MSASLIKEVFGENVSLYDILKVERSATAEMIKKAYRKCALLWHPDKAGTDEIATKKFQCLSFIHSVLSDPDRRKSYDQTGFIEEEHDFDSESFNTWKDYWSTLFPPVTSEAIAAFSASYRNSDEESADVLREYETLKGNMDEIMMNVMLSTEEDYDRFVALIKNAIDEKKVKLYKSFEKDYKGVETTRRTLRAKKEREEAIEADKMLNEAKSDYSRKTGKSSSDVSLEDLIRSRQESRQSAFMSTIENIEAKYASKKPKVRAIKDKK